MRCAVHRCTNSRGRVRTILFYNVTFIAATRPFSPWYMFTMPAIGIKVTLTHQPYTDSYCLEKRVGSERRTPNDFCCMLSYGSPRFRRNTLDNDNDYTSEGGLPRPSRRLAQFHITETFRNTMQVRARVVRARRSRRRISPHSCRAGLCDIYHT